MTSITKFSIITGLALIIMGVGYYVAYLGSELESVTALIPAFVGLPILICGFLARDPKKRKMVAHIAATVGLLGALAGLGRGLPKLIGGSRESAVIATLLMGIICTIYVIACVQSFIAVRKARG